MTSSSCEKNGFVMSPSRGTKGEVKWSSCSSLTIASMNLPCLTDRSDFPAEWDHQRLFGEYPGLYWTPDEQCKILLRKNTSVNAHDQSYYPKQGMCERLLCKANDGTLGIFANGPALKGNPYT